MTDDPRTICKRCGFANVPGDQFCGSCGAFLEWEGQPADAAAAAAAGTGAAAPSTPDPATAAGAAGAAAAPTSAAWGAPYGDPIPTPVRPSTPEPDTYDQDGDGIPDGPLVRCPACGIANPSNRTFCQSCGTTLAAASRVVEPAPEQVAAAVAWTPTAAPPPGPMIGASASARGRSGGPRGIPTWVIGVAVVGLLVGVAIVLAGLALRGNPPGTATHPSAAAPSGSAASAGTRRERIAGQRLAGLGRSAGADRQGVVAPQRLAQVRRRRRRSTATSRPAGRRASQQEKDQWIEVTFGSARADTLVVSNGAQASAAQFKGYRRLKDIVVTVGGKSIPFRLKDTMKPQQIDLGGVAGATSVRITIVTTYAGQATTAANTPADIAAVSEISVLGVPGG